MQLGPAEICGIRKPKVTFRSNYQPLRADAGRSPMPAYAETLKNESLFYGRSVARCGGGLRTTSLNHHTTTPSHFLLRAALNGVRI
jgi:hypothetical protein